MAYNGLDRTGLPAHWKNIYIQEEYTMSEATLPQTKPAPPSPAAGKPKKPLDKRKLRTIIALVLVAALLLGGGVALYRFLFSSNDKPGEILSKPAEIGSLQSRVAGSGSAKAKESAAITLTQGGTVQAVNFNCPGQIVIAGSTKAVEEAAAAMKEAGAKRAILLHVSAPFHSTLMEPAAKRLAEVLDDITISDAKIPVVANVNGQIETSAADIKSNLVKQAASPVLWIDCTKTMQAFGAETFVEVGPGKTLCGFNRKIDRKIHSENVEDIPSLQKTLEFFQEVR